MDAGASIAVRILGSPAVMFGADESANLIKEFRLAGLREWGHVLLHATQIPSRSSDVQGNRLQRCSPHLVGRLRASPVATKRKTLLILVAAILVIGGCGYCAYQGSSVRTERDAGPQDVSFLDLPASASRIGYWRDGINHWSEFDIPEDDFRSLFRDFQFREITEAIKVRSKTFGDPSVFPPEAPNKPVTVSTGLSYNERWSNGGGYNIVYDRSRSRAYYDFSKR
jgi:hypothetical protein